jgi:hypothetical protein
VTGIAVTMSQIPIISSRSEIPPIGNTGGADPPPINDRNQSPRHTQGDREGGGGGSSLQDAVAMMARNNNNGMCTYTPQYNGSTHHRGIVDTDWYSRGLGIDPRHHRI